VSWCTRSIHAMNDVVHGRSGHGRTMYMARALYTVHDRARAMYMVRP